MEKQSRPEQVMKVRASWQLPSVLEIDTFFLPWIILITLLLVAFWIRIQGVPNIPERGVKDGQFLRVLPEPDANCVSVKISVPTYFSSVACVSVLRK